MAQSPWKLGDREPYWGLALQPDTGTLDITGLTTSDFTMIFIDSGGNERVGDGTFTGLTAASGSTPASITYRQSANDVATASTFRRRVVIKRGTTAQRTFDFGTWVCER